MGGQLDYFDIPGRKYIVLEENRVFSRGDSRFLLYVDEVEGGNRAEGQDLLQLAKNTCRAGLYFSSPGDVVTTISAPVLYPGLILIKPVSAEQLSVFGQHWISLAHFEDVERDKNKRLEGVLKSKSL